MAAASRASRRGIDVLLHCAGLEISHYLPDKPQRECDLVFDVKAHGWFNLLQALGDAEIGTAIGFSSIAGRFGNAGQTDYAAANDLLCKSVSAFRRDRPGDPRRHDRLDRMGGDRHGGARLDPEDDGDGRHRHAAARRRHPRGAPRGGGSRGGRRGPRRRQPRRAAGRARSGGRPRRRGRDRPARRRGRPDARARGRDDRRRRAADRHASSIRRPRASSTTTASTARRCCRA